MKSTYNFKKKDAYWQNEWEKAGIFQADNNSKKKKFYALIEFPYPSGAGLHVGHVRSNTAMDIIARKRRAEGYNVLYPIGWDAFGLPTENYAIKTKQHPKNVTKQNTETFKRQIKLLGTSFDWSREINTTDPAYYKWTQWIFLKLFEKELAYKDTISINWCVSCKIGLANEEVVNGKCERCGGDTEKRKKEQWLLAITKYAERLLKGLDTVDYIEPVKIQQRNWIGRSEGAEVFFKVDESEHILSVFTTRVDTIYSAAFMVVAPEHELIHSLEEKIENIKEVKKYIKTSAKKTEIDRTNIEQEKTGVELKGVYAVNPINNKKIPVWVGDFVIGGYGTGAVFGDAHDERDFVMAKKYEIPLTISIVPEDSKIKKQVEKFEVCFTEDGILVNSGDFNGMTSEEARKKITKFLEKNKNGQSKVNYKLRDWVFSRQRYWGEPIPIVYCEKEGAVPLPESALPLELPEIEKYEPTDSGESPLANIDEWVNTTCPKCNGPAKRETDVMPNWAGSSWYFLRYTDPTNDKELASKKYLKQWMPVDWYNGGMEHTTLHLLYSRFWNYFLYDIGVVKAEEPYTKRTSHGMILAEGGEKMSKSKGNVINPDDIINEFGADVLRLYEMFMGPFEQAISWSSKDIYGVKRFCDKSYEFVEWISKAKEQKETDEDIKRIIHQTIKKVTEDIESMSFNTAVAQMMTCMNTLKKEVEIGEKKLSKGDVEIFIKLLSPYAPHIAEEMWHMLGNDTLVEVAPWPESEKKYLKENKVTIVIQVNGKVRGNIEVAAGTKEKEILDLVSAQKNISSWLEGKDIKKSIYIKDRLINIVVS